MKRIQRDADIIREALQEWENSGQLSAEKSEELKNDLQVVKQDYASLSFYALIAAVSCIVLSFGALVVDEKWIERLRRIFSLSELVIVAIFLTLSTLLYFWLKKNRNKPHISKTAIDIFFVFFVLCLGVAMAYIAKYLALNLSEIAYFLFIIAAILAAVAISLDSKFIWIIFLASFVYAIGLNTFVLSKDVEKIYFLGMNFPVRMTVICGVLAFVSFTLIRWERMKFFESITKYVFTVLFLFSGLLLSIFGNSSYEGWLQQKQYELIVWSLGYTALLVLLLVISLRYRWEILRDVTIVFFIVNLYVRFFEYFWDKTNKGIFFAILAVSFWWLSQRAEKLWKKYLK